MSAGSLLRQWCAFLARVEAELATHDTSEARELIAEIRIAKDECYSLMQPDQAR
jgi:hypothetical protein